MLNFPLVGAMTPGITDLDPLKAKKRDWRTSLFDKLMPDGGLQDEQKQALVRQGLLSAGLQMLQTGGGFGNALGAGLQGGLLAMNQGKQDIAADQYRQDIARRMQAKSQEELQLRELQARVVRPDGKLDQAAFSQYAAIDPQGAKALRDAIEPQTKWSLGELGDGSGGKLPVFYDPTNPGTVLDVAGQPVFGRQQPMGPQGGSLIAPTDPSQFYSTVGDLIAPYGGRITSTTGGKHNPGSLHPGGGAVDVGMGRESQEQQAQILAALQGDPNLIVRDERQRPQGQAQWSGPHLHVERTGGGGGQSAGGFAGRPGYTPAKPQKAEPVLLSPQEVQAMGLPKGTVAERGPNGVQVLHKPSDRGPEVDDGMSPGERKEVRKDFFGARQALVNFQNLDKALTAIPQSGALDPESKGRLGTAYNNARAALRLVYNTGVLQPGELPMLESALRDPSGYAVMLDPRLRDQMRGQLDELYRALTSQIQLQTETYPGMFKPERMQEGGQILKDARNAVMRGADKEAVRQRMIESGYPNLAMVL